MNMIWFLRMAKWARRPPSVRHVILVLVVIAVALVILGAETFGLWPEWATMERGRRGPNIRLTE